MALLLTLSVDKDESGQHEEGVEVEHFAIVVLKGESLVKLEDPVGKQQYGAPKANLGEDPKEAE